MPVNVGQFTPSDWGKIVELQMYKDSGNATKEQTEEIDEFTDEVNDALKKAENGELTGEQDGDNVEVTNNEVPQTAKEIVATLEYDGEYASTPESIQMVIDTGEKCTPENILAVAQHPETNQVMWLETGNESAGLEHIIKRHMKEFAQKGIVPEQIPDVIFTALTKGEIVGTQGSKPPPRNVYKINFGGRNIYIAISIGDNGFVIGMNFVSEKEYGGYNEKYRN